MICKTRRFGCARTIASTRSSRRGGTFGARVLGDKSVSAPLVLLLLLVLVLGGNVRAAETLDPEVGRMLERALADAERLRTQLPNLEYDAKLRVQEWDGRGRLRGTAKATAIMRPGDPKPMTFISREIQGKVRFPEERSSSSKDDDDDKSTLQEFSAKHQIPERFDFQIVGTDNVAGQPAKRVAFKPKANPPKKRNTADRFLGLVEGTAWVSAADNKLVKFEMRLQQPFKLLWIIAVLRELSINYELVERDHILGRAKLKVLFSLRTPIYSIRQLHDVEMANFRPRNSVATVQTSR